MENGIHRWMNENKQSKRAIMRGAYLLPLFLQPCRFDRKRMKLFVKLNRLDPYISVSNPHCDIRYVFI